MTQQAEPPQPTPAWASGMGHVGIGPLVHEQEINRIVDRAMIAERIARYGWAYDERNSSLLGDCFTQEGVWEGNIMGIEPVGPFEGRQAILDYLVGFWNLQSDQRRHLFTNVLIDELTDTNATAYAYLQLTSSSNRQLTPVVTGPYRFMLKKEDDSWRISRLIGGWDTPFESPPAYGTRQS